jgi:hypothetical protein
LGAMLYLVLAHRGREDPETLRDRAHDPAERTGSGSGNPVSADS